MPRAAAFLLLTAYAVNAFAASAAQEFGARRWSDGPRLRVDGQPRLCAKILASANEMFASSATDLDVASAVAVEFPPVEMRPAVDGAEEGAPSRLERLDLDLDGSGRSQVVIYRDNSFNWRGNWHYAYVFPSAAAFDAAKEGIGQDWLKTPADSQYPPPEKREYDSQQYYPSALTIKGDAIQTGDVWAEHSLFAFANRYYFAAGTTAWDRQGLTELRIFRLDANGKVELTCEVEYRNSDEVYKAFLALPAVGSLLAILRTIGAGGEDGGTMHSGQMHDARATAAELRAAYRPWATSAETKPGYAGDHPYYRYDQRTRDFLEAWSLSELWNRREYQTLLELLGPAEASYATYVQSAFGVAADAARIDAIKVVQQLIGARLEIPNGYSSMAAHYDYFPSTPLHRAVMRRDRLAFDAALALPQAAAEQRFGQPPKPAPEIVSDALSDAVEWPYGLVRLLAAGADPDHANGFGKTTLMVAAHFDRVDAVRELLKAGANVNAVTGTPSQTWMEAPKRTGRSALMYAAENAGPAVMKALLEAGADPVAQDSGGNGMSFYLARNPRLTDAERALGVAGLAKEADQFAGPSFSCEKAHTAAERSICGSEILRIFDAQIARAFTVLLGTRGASEREEQRSWLQVREQSCSGGGDPDCLAEVMRTHLRYMRYRLAEALANQPGQP